MITTYDCRKLQQITAATNYITSNLLLITANYCTFITTHYYISIAIITNYVR
jgi:hypothetical protein